MMPGPALAATIVKGYESKNAGLFIALGHGTIELPLIAFIGFGLEQFLNREPLLLLIGIGGGLVLIYMGYAMFKLKRTVGEGTKYIPYSPLVVGILTTALNPGFFVWWMTVGAILISIAVGFGLWILVIFALIHWSCDFIFDYFVTFSVYKTKHLWSEKTHKIVFGTCGILLLSFGIWFIVSSVYPYFQN